MGTPLVPDIRGGIMTKPKYKYMSNKETIAICKLNSKIQFDYCQQKRLDETLEMLNMTRDNMAKGRQKPVIGDRTFYQLLRHFEKSVTQQLKLKWS